MENDNESAQIQETCLFRLAPPLFHGLRVLQREDALPSAFVQEIDTFLLELKESLTKPAAKGSVSIGHLSLCALGGSAVGS